MIGERDAPRYARKNALPGPRWMLLLAIIAIGVLAARGSALIAVLGHNIPQPAIEADYLLGVVLALLIGASIIAWPVPAEDRRAQGWLWLARCVVTLGFMLAYEWNYSLAAYGYFGRARTAGLDVS